MNDHVLGGYLQNEEEVKNGGNSVVSYTYYGTNPHLLCLNKSCNLRLSNLSCM